jgi:hypothetical protein
MAKKSVKKKEEVVKKGFDVKVKLDKTEKGRITVTVTLLQDGEVVASDYDFVQV